MLLNFCLLVTCAFLLSLTYQEGTADQRRSWRAAQLLLAAVSSLALAYFAEQEADLRLDLRYVPIALTTLRYGFGPGLLVAVPVALFRLLDNPLAGFFTAVNVLLTTLAFALVRPHVDLLHARPTRRQWALLLAPFTLVHLNLWTIPALQERAAERYLLTLLFNSLGLLVVRLILISRLRLLQVTQAYREQAFTDPLTGLGNRRAFERDLEHLLPGMQVALLDVDQLRRVNERGGRGAGDAALLYLTQLLQEAPGARAYRIGGEEFALLGQDTAQDLSGWLRNLLRQLPRIQGVAWAGLSVSAGLATLAPGARAAETLLRADAALFAAKLGGSAGFMRDTDLPEPEPSAPAPAEAQEAAQALQPRFMLWQSLRTTTELLAQRRYLTQEDWQTLLELALACVARADEGTINIRRGSGYQVQAASGFQAFTLGLQFSEEVLQRWHGPDAALWQSGQPRVLRGAAVRERWRDAESACTPEDTALSVLFRDAAPRPRLHATLCVPVVVDGRVAGHLNLDAFSSEDAFGPGSVEVATLFAQQLAALLKLQERWRQMEALTQLNDQVNQAFSPDAAAQLTETVMELLRAHQVVLLRYDPDLDVLHSVHVRGPFTHMPSFTLRRGEGVTWEALSRGQILRLGNPRQDVRLRFAERVRDESMLVVPLMGHLGQPLGALVLTRVAGYTFQDEDEQLARMLSGMVARVMERGDHIDELQATLEAALGTVGVALEVRDFETQGHTRRVQTYAQILGTALGLDETQMTALRHGATLHDVGKLGIPDAVLLKPGKLTPEERRSIEEHPLIGARIAGRIPFLQQGAHDVIRSHHERWDGQGYPDALHGEQIPLLARLFSLCDVYDALVSERPYKTALPPHEAIEIIREGRGTRFDPALTDLFTGLWAAGKLNLGGVEAD